MKENESVIEPFESAEEAMIVLDSILNKLKSANTLKDSDMVGTNPKVVEATYKVMKHIARGKKISVTHELNEPYSGMGFVSVTGEKIEIINPLLFSRVIELSSNFEVYSKTDGSIQMNFTFHNLVRKAGD